MRILSIFILLLSAGLAGCVDGDAGADDTLNGGTIAAETTARATVPGMYQSHPAYGFPTSGQIPMTEDGRTRVVEDDGTVQWFRPEGETWSGRVPTGIEAVANVDTTQGHGIAVFGPLVFYGGDGQTNPPLIVVDITDPEAPAEVGRHDEVPVRDADTILYPDGRLVVITTGGGSAQYATDVTDPSDPRLVAETETSHGNHNIAVVPGTPIVYNSGSNGFIDVLDYSDPADPLIGQPFWNGHGCHDITFYMDETKQRAYCAASNGDRIQIWDLEDPLFPRVIYDGAFPTVDESLPDAASSNLPLGTEVSPGSISHLAMVNHDASILIVGDETGGGGVNGCDFYYEADGETYSGPHGNLWFFDLSDETDPVLLSHISPEAYDGGTEYDGGAQDQPGTTAGSCTSHFGRLVEDTGVLAMSFYTSGVLLIDFTDPSAPVIVDRIAQGGSVWDVWYQDGYLYTGDTGRGMDVLRLV